MTSRMIALLSIYAVMVATSCSNSAQGEAAQQPKDIQEAVKENSPGGVATSDNGNYMKAKIDGRDWSAAFVTPDYDESSSYLRIAGNNDGDAISFTMWKQGIRIGKSERFSDHNAVDFTLTDVPGIMGGLSGEAVITAFDDQWVEGTFYFTATGSNTDRKVEVTDGHFRISRVKGAK